uniref:C2H2-type domain-containing protein n=1 Tax=Anopheles farauti TaxID=69004 RepID=A0A182QRN0_9DIPT
MPYSIVSQRNNIDLLQENKHWNAEFTRLFWNPFAKEPESLKKAPERKRAFESKISTANPRKHRCSHCAASFRWPADLYYHDAYHHSELRLNVCPMVNCERNFQFPYQLTNHQRTAGHHNWQVQCAVCGKRFAAERYLGRHTEASCEQYRLDNPKERTDGNKESHG